MARRKVKRQPGRHKRWGQQKVNSGPAKMAGYMNDQKKFVDMSLGSRSQVARGGDGYTRNHEYLLKKYPAPPPLEQSKPEQIVAKAKAGYPRAVVLTQLMQGKFRWQKEQKIRPVKLVDGKWTKLTLYIGGSILFFVQEKVFSTHRIFLHSINYPDLDGAMYAYKQGRIDYIGRVEEEFNPP